MNRETDGPGRQLPGPSEDTSPGKATVPSMVAPGTRVVARRTHQGLSSGVRTPLRKAEGPGIFATSPGPDAATTWLGGLFPMVPYPDARRCPRCGVPFAWTTDEVLRRCTELARRGAA
jgi:hypothetical protein